ncbi:MAG: phosphate regulon sensor histidine kinase PhoR [Rhodocyclaceae bacterium]|nr:phosphate regulon sensor histidine kinase PhoR [Rhodocyclaceae bacterium]
MNSLLITLAWFAALGLPAWFFVGPLAAVAVVALLALWRLAGHERQIKRLTTWAGQPGNWENVPPPEASGSWSAAFLALHRRAKKAASQREALREMNDRFRLAIAALPEGVVILDPQRNIEWINPRAEQLLGLDSLRDIGMPVAHLVREPEFIAFLALQKEQGEAPPPLLVRPIRSGGRTLLVRGAPFSDGRALLLIEDLTQLDRLESVRRDFVANVSHEMRTPLTVVRGFLETAQDGMANASPEEMAHYLATALEHAHRMQRLIEDLLTLSSLETGAPPPEEAVDVAALLAGVKADALALSTGRHVITLENSGPAILTGNARELHSAFGNLASNAVRYTPEGGQITLAWRKLADGGAAFSVTDSGIGIASQHIPRLTERFYRVDRGRSRDSGGTGLGLAIVKHVLERHQATLTIESRPGAGSTFTAAFPARRIG